MRVAIALALVVAGACEDTRRADPRDRRDHAEDEVDDSDTLRAYSQSQSAKKRLSRILADAQPAAAGAYECDELVRLVRCTYDKSGSAITDDVRKMFEDGVKAWQDALGNAALRQATIDQCKLSLDAGRQGFNALGCY